MKVAYIVLASFLAFFLNSCDDSDSGTNDDGGDSGNIENNLTSEGASYEVDGELKTFDQAKVQANNPVAGFTIITLPDPISLQLRMIPSETGTYNVGEGPSDFRLVDIWYWDENNNQYLANKDKGSGTITLTEAGTLGEGADYSGHAKGTFSCTVVDQNGDEIKITNGKFFAVSAFD
ncbi:MAG: hypothetical protein Kapaf2KO_02960 [Candidatus Kapaibacteriales bacterium]